jgi:long-chain acyl-CoA synthetase
MAPMIEEYTEAWNELTASGGPFAMTEIEVRGVPMRVFDSAPPSMRFVWEMATGYGDKDYVVFEDERFTYAESDAIIKALAKHLVDDLGVRHGDRVAVKMPNKPQWVFKYRAIV